MSTEFHKALVVSPKNSDFTQFSLYFWIFLFIHIGRKSKERLLWGFLWLLKKRHIWVVINTTIRSLTSFWEKLWISYRDVLLWIYLLIYFFGHAAYGILVPWSGIELGSPAVKAQILFFWKQRFLTTGQPGMSLDLLIWLLYTGCILCIKSYAQKRRKQILPP